MNNLEKELRDLIKKKKMLTRSPENIDQRVMGEDDKDALIK